MDDQRSLRLQRQRSSDHVVAVYCVMALVAALSALVLLHDIFGFGLVGSRAWVAGKWLALTGVANLIVSYLWTNLYGTRW